MARSRASACSSTPMQVQAMRSCNKSNLKNEERTIESPAMRLLRLFFEYAHIPRKNRATKNRNPHLKRPCAPRSRQRILHGEDARQTAPPLSHSAIKRRSTAITAIAKVRYPKRGAGRSLNDVSRH